MHFMHETPGLNLRALIAAALAAGLVGLLGLMLIGGSGTADSTASQFSEETLPQGARYPLADDKFAPGRFDGTPETEAAATYPTPCHGEGLMDLAIQALLVGDNQSVAQYCEPRARIAGGADTAEPESDATYPRACHGEGLSVPMDPAAQSAGPGSLAEFCTSDADSEADPDSDQLFPGENDPFGRRDY